jgi:hypothetical protein
VSARRRGRVSARVHGLDEEGAAMTRRERQHAQIDADLGRGQVARAVVLARAHLAEFPDDLDVQAAVVLATRVAKWEMSAPRARYRTQAPTSPSRRRRQRRADSPEVRAHGWR